MECSLRNTRNESTRYFGTKLRKEVILFFCVKVKMINIEIFFTSLCVKRGTRIVKILGKNNAHQHNDEQKFLVDSHHIVHF